MVLRQKTEVLALCIVAVCTLLLGIVKTAPVHAAINPQINFQGKLTNPDSTNVTNGTYSIRFRIYTDPTLDAANTCSANTCKWEETQASISVTDGIFNVALGSSTVLPGSVDFNSSALYLGMKVGADTEMTPRIQLTASPYAFNSDKLDGIDSTGFAILGQAAAQTDATSNSTIFINKTSTGNLIQLQASAVDAFTVTNSGSLALGQNANKTISVVQTASNAAGKSLTLTAGQGGAGASANAGGDLALQGGIGGGTNGNGGNVLLAGGLPNGSGTAGTVIVQSSADSTTAFAVKNAAGTSTPLAVDTTNNRVNINGGLVINTADSNIVRTTFADFALGTVGASILNSTNPTGQLELADGTVPNAGKGTITTAGQPAMSSNVGAGAQSILRSDGKYLVLAGTGSTTASCATAGTALSIFDSIANTFTATAAGQCLSATGIGAGALVIPRSDGKYSLAFGNASATRNTIDPLFLTNPVADVSGTTCATFGAGSNMFKRADGRYILICGNNLTATAIFDPSNTTPWIGAGPAMATAANAGSLILPKTDGMALVVLGGNTSTTALYNPTTGVITGTGPVGAFSVGPSLDGASAVGTCGINNAGSAGIKRPDGKFVIVSKAGVSALYDPIANTMTCRATGPAAALGDGAHAIPLQDGVFLIIRGGAQTDSYVYDSNADTFTTQGTAFLNTVTSGAHSILRQDGKWQIIEGAGGAPTGTQQYDTGLPMNGATALYRVDDISTTSLNATTTVKWTASTAGPYASSTNAASNTAFSTIQVFERTAVNSSGCTTPLNSATDAEITNSGDFLKPGTADNCVRFSVQFNRPLPRRPVDERGTFTGNGSTAMRLDYVTPTLYDISLDNSTVMHRDSFSFNFSNPTNSNGVTPAAPTSNVPGGVGSCTSGNHFWFVSFVTAGVESRLSAASAVRSCSGANIEGLTAIPTGPTGTTARKIYRTAAAALVTDTPFLVGTLADNSTVIYNDSLADASLGAAYSALSTDGSGPVTNRVEAANGALILPYGHVPQSAMAGTTGFYLGLPSAISASMPQAQTNEGTIVIQRPNKTFKLIASLSAPAANGSMYDPATQTFGAAEAGSNIPTAANGAGGFALKRPDGKYLIVLGNTGTTTNIYDADANVFSTGPVMSAAVGLGAYAIPNTDGTFTIVHGAAATTSSIYDPVRNTMLAGPTLPTASNCGGMALPWAAPNNNLYTILPGVASGAASVATTMNYNAASKTFSAGTNLVTNTAGCGAIAFQRQDGFWIIIDGDTTAAVQTTTEIFNPFSGSTGAGPALATGGGRGMTVLPRADGTFLVTVAAFNASSTTSQLYIPWGGTTIAGGAPLGSFVAGPTLATAVGAGAVTFQRSDGKWVIINGQATATTQLIDTGWYASGTYVSEQANVPSLTAGSILNWQQTADNYVSAEARSAASQAALGSTAYNSVGRPGSSIGNAGSETWVQIQFNLSRDFPSYGSVSSPNTYLSGGGNAYPYRTIALPTVSQYSLNNGTDLLTLQDDGLNVFRVTSQGNVYTSGSGGYFSGGADLAENYTSTDTLLAGEVVAIDPALSLGVKRATGQYQKDVLGVVSTTPGFVAGALTKDSYPIALVGRVPVKISTENGTIKQGDYLTTASIPGYAMRATVSGRVIGTALDSFDTAKATSCPSAGLGSVTTTKCGMVNMFVNLTNYSGASVEALMAENPRGEVTGEAIVTGVNFPSVDGLSGDAISKENDILKFLSQLKDRQMGNVTGGDIFTNRVSAVNEVISPVIVAGIVRAKTIQAEKIIGLEVYTDKVAKLSDVYAGLQTQQDKAVKTITTDIPNLKDVKFSSGEFSVSLVSLGNIESKGGLTVGGNSLFKGKATFMALAEFYDAVTFNSDISANGRVTFNKDAGGSVVIKKGDTRVSIAFEKEYATQPVIGAQLVVAEVTLPDKTKEPLTVTENRILTAGYSYFVSNVQAKGFTIVLNKPAAEDLQFNWSANAVKGASTFLNQPTTTTGGQ